MYYRIDKKFSKSQITNIETAMREWERCGVKFIPMSNTIRSSFLLILKSNNKETNQSTLGDNGISCMQLYNAEKMYIIRHELGHVLGLLHEHQRPDRDTYITVHKENIDPEVDYDLNFGIRKNPLFDEDTACIAKDLFEEKTTNTSAPDYVSFDYMSIMMYHPLAASKNFLPVITRTPVQYNSIMYIAGDIISRCDCEKVKFIYKKK